MLISYFFRHIQKRKTFWGSFQMVKLYFGKIRKINAYILKVQINEKQCIFDVLIFTSKLKLWSIIKIVIHHLVVIWKECNLQFWIRVRIFQHFLLFSVLTFLHLRMILSYTTPNYKKYKNVTVIKTYLLH